MPLNSHDNDSQLAEHQLPESSSPPDQGVTPDNWRHALATGPHWQNRYLVARLACDTDNEAVVRSRVSVPIVMREVERNPAFAELRQQAIDRTLSAGTEDATQLAREASPRIIENSIALADNRDPDTGEKLEGKDRVLHRDQLGFGNQILEVARLKGGRANVHIGDTHIVNSEVAWLIHQQMTKAPPDSVDPQSQ